MYDGSGFNPINNQGPKYPDNGVWRSWVTLNWTEEKVYHPGDQSKVATRKTEYEYDPATNHQIKANQCGVYGQYGNVSKIKEYVNGSLYRQTERWYVFRDEVGGSPPTYVVDRLIQETVRDGAGNYLAWSDYVYDEVPTASYTCGAKLGTEGELQLVRKYSNVEADPRNQTLYSQDTSYGYDNYGNRTVERIYQSPGRMWLNSNWSVTFYAAGDGSTSATTTTDYDTTFHAFPVKTTSAKPGWTSGTALVTEVGYDYRMGLLTSVTDANDQTTYLQHDEFGRKKRMWKPGDSSTYPTVQFTYYDSENPVRVRLDLREESGTANVRTSYSFYDGLGRQIQTQAEGDGFYVVTDRKHDGLDQVTNESVAHSGSGTFGAYTSPDGTVKWTTTTYDWAGRPLVTTFPDTTTTEHRYGVYQDTQLGWITYDDVIDQNRHLIQHRYDPLGRLVKALEYTGTDPWTTYAETTYSYDPLDRLTQVQDAKGNITQQITYDSLGRKTQMIDKDMGTWYYTYDANGNLTRQRDARNNRICFYYDALSRLKGKHYRTDDTCPADATSNYHVTLTYDGAVPNGKGQLTQSEVKGTYNNGWTVRKSYEYDARGRTNVVKDYASDGSTTRERKFTWTYDSGDRLYTLKLETTWPTSPSYSETLTYDYDEGWRLRSVQTNKGSLYYAQSARYTALDQLSEWTLGNSRIRKMTYSSPMQRLQQLQLGTSSTPGSIFDRSYGYDNKGNVASITDNKDAVNNQTFGYDFLDRLTNWTLSGTPHTYGYDQIGNLTNNDGTSQTYGSNGNGTGDGPHQMRSYGGNSVSYDANGNVTSWAGGGPTLTWTYENRLATNSTGSQSFAYDANNERVIRALGSTKTLYLI